MVFHHRPIVYIRGLIYSRVNDEHGYLHRQAYCPDDKIAQSWRDCLVIITVVDFDNGIFVSGALLIQMMLQLRCIIFTVINQIYQHFMLQMLVGVPVKATNGPFGENLQKWSLAISSSPGT